MATTIFGRYRQMNKYQIHLEFQADDDTLLDEMQKELITMLRDSNIYKYNVKLDIERTETGE